MGSPSLGVASPGKASRSGKGAESALDMVDMWTFGAGVARWRAVA
jgi:hypothetical protein